MDTFIKKETAKRIKVARTFFIISAIYGLILRFYHISDSIPVSYKNILQAHSHVTFLGWGFLAVITLIGLVYYPEKAIKSKYLKYLFQIMTLSLFGMLISFPLQGYKLFSIVFLSIFLVTSYLYLFKVFSFIKHNKSISAKFIKTGIYYYFLSSLAIWTVALITVKYGKITMYFNAVYFYLHFLYNGFFVFTLFGLLLAYFNKNNIVLNKIYIIRFYWFTNIALIPAYSLSLLWNKMPNYVYIIGFFAVILQLISLVYLKYIYNELVKSILLKHIKFITHFVFYAYFIKIFFQFLSAFPDIISLALKYKPYFIVGYIHLFTLGFMSMFIILLLKLIPKKQLSELGINFLMLGIFLSEILLFGQGVSLLFLKKGIPNINYLLFIVSSLMPIGIIIIHLKLMLKRE